MKIDDEAKIVPGVWEALKREHERDLKTDPEYRRSYERLAERQIRARVKVFEKGGRRLAEMRKIPGFTKDVECKERTITAMQAAILDAKKRSGLTQCEIARRMGIPQGNVSRLEHNPNALTYRTFAAYLNACGFGFRVELTPLAE